MSEDLLKTPIDDIINNRAKLMGLATNLFQRTSPSVIRAFGQFGRNPELARVIEAKRNGIFDYGACIVDTSAGVKWPTDTAKVLEAIDKAEKGEITIDDLTPLFSGNREAAEAQFQKVVLKAAPAKTKKPKIVDPEVKVEAKAEPVKDAEPQNVVPFKAREETKETKPEVKAAVAGDVSEKLELIGQGLAQLRDEVNAKLYKIGETMAVTRDVDVILEGFEILLKNQAVLNQNLKTIATCFGGVELEDVVEAPSEDTRKATPADPPISTSTTKIPESVDPGKVEELPPEAGGNTEAAPAASEKEVEVTEELLASLEIDALVELCGKLGVKLTTKAGSKPYASVVKNKIRVAVGLPTVEKK